MKINYKNQNLKILNWNDEYSCALCAFNPQHDLYYCNLFCDSNKIWTVDIFNSDIFCL